MLRTVICLLLAIVFPLPGLMPDAASWSNGGYSADIANPDYGTHDYIAERAMRLLPVNETRFLQDNLAVYLYGTELPDLPAGTGGIGDTMKHHIYYRASGTLQDNASAVRALAEFNGARANLTAGNLTGAARAAGTMTHYIADTGVFGHVMGAYTDWGAEQHHSDYEANITTNTTSNISAVFDKYLVFDGTLDLLSPYDAALRLAYNTTVGNGADLKNCTWMDDSYNWSDPAFCLSAGNALNLSINMIADVLHTLAVMAGYGASENIAPEIHILSPSEGSFLNGPSITVNGTASDESGVMKVELSADGINWSTADGTTNWSKVLCLYGNVTISVRATDILYNSNTTSVRVRVYDRANPQVWIEVPNEGSVFYCATANVRVLASDDREITSVKIGLDTGSWVECQKNGTRYEMQLTLLQGPNTIYARAEDNDGNINTTSVAVTADLDPTPVPGININHPAEGSILNTTAADLRGNASDHRGVREVKVTTDGINWSPCIGTEEWSCLLTLPEGNHTANATVWDVNGNTNTTSVSFSIVLPDTSPPTVTIVSPAPMEVVPSFEVGFCGTAFDDHVVCRIEISTDNLTWRECTNSGQWAIQLTLPEGCFTAYVRATDSSGNQKTENVQFSVRTQDTTAPRVEILAPGEGAVVDSFTVTLSGTSGDDRQVAVVELQAGSLAYVQCTGTLNWTGSLTLPAGNFEVYIRVKDTSGNAGVASVNISVIGPDATNPTVSISSPQNGRTQTGPSITVRGTARDDRSLVKVEGSLDGINWVNASGTGNWSMTLKGVQGKNAIRIKATDASGNTGTENVNVTVAPQKTVQNPRVPLLLIAILLVVAVVLLAIGIHVHKRRRARAQQHHDKPRARHENRHRRTDGTARPGRNHHQHPRHG